MWSSIRSDFKEFVSTVRDDTSHVLSQLDRNFPDGEADNNNIANSSADGSNDNSQVVSEDEPEEDLTEEMEECLRRMELEETFTAPLLDDAETDEDEKAAVQAFLADFNVESHTDDIASVLQRHASLQQNFARLVPTHVPYNDFWTRYYYRCNEARIVAQWAAEDVAAAQARAQAVSKTIGSVRNFLGGAVTGLTQTLTEPDERSAPSTGNSGVAGAFTMTQNQAQKAGIFGGVAGRPPFVMNTAVDEDDDDGKEEEELGWSDDDEENGDEEDDNVDESSEQIEFNDAATEKLQEQLKQAIDERDQLHDTVELQKQQLAELQQKISTGSSTSDDGDDNVEALKMQLWEKGSELAAMKEKLNDSFAAVNDGSTAAAANTDDGVGAKLQMQLAEREAQAAAAQQELLDKQTELDAQARQVAVLEARIAELQALTTTSDTSAANDHQMTVLQGQLAARDEQVAAAAHELAQKEAAWQDERQGMKTALDELQQRETSLQEQLAAAIAEHKEQQASHALESEKVATEFRSELESVRAAHLQVQGEKDELVAKCATLEQSLAAAHQHGTELQTELDDARAELLMMQHKASALEAEVQAAAVLQQSSSGGGGDSRSGGNSGGSGGSTHTDDLLPGAGPTSSSVGSPADDTTTTSGVKLEKPPTSVNTQDEEEMADAWDDEW